MKNPPPSPWSRIGVLSAAVSLIFLNGCVRDYVMPPAKARLPGYQLESAYSEGLALVKNSEDFRLGYMDMEGHIVIPTRFSHAGLFSEGLAPAKVDAHQGYGYIDQRGRTVIEPGFDAALPFAGMLAPVRLGGKWGYIGRDGAFRIEPRFDDAFAFSEGRARVVVEGLAGFIDETGSWVAQPVYFRAGEFHEGLAFVSGPSRCGFIGRDGRVAVNLRFDDAGSFSEGLAPVREGNLWGYIDRSGKMVISPTYDQAADFSDGLARVARIKDGSSSSRFGGYSGRAPFFGFIDRAGKQVIDTVIHGVEPFAGGLAIVRVPARGFSTDSYDVRLINRDGEFLPGRFNRAGGIGAGRAVVSMGDQSYVIDAKGDPLIELDSSYPSEPSHAARNVSDVRYGYIDPAGRPVIEHAYILAQPFSEGLAFAEGPWSHRSRRRGYIDAAGGLAIPVPDSIAQAFPFTQGLALVSERRGGTLLYGYLNSSGEMGITARYANAAPFTDGLAAVKLSAAVDAQDWGYIDVRGSLVILPQFKAAGPFDNGLAYVERVTEERYLVGAVINAKGEVVVDKPHLMDWSHALFGVPSLEQHRIRTGMGFRDGLIPRLDGFERGYVDRANRLVISDPRFLHLGLFAEGRAPVLIRDGTSSRAEWGYIDTQGRIMGEIRFAQAGPFGEGLAAVRDHAGRTGFIKPDGTWAIEPLWLEDARPFKRNRALIKLNNRFGYLDPEGRFVIPPRFLRAESFSEGLAVTAVAGPHRAKPEK